jgi:hypothetical protein
MRNRFEVVYVDPRGGEQVLTRTLPNGFSGKWKVVKRYAAKVLPHPIKETGENPLGLTYVVASVSYPGSGFVGIRECQ